MRGALFLFAVACGGDADYDGFAGDDDCDDADPFVYPGAPDDPADGVDADCDGVDPALALVGEWSLTAIDAEYSGFALFLPGDASGTLAVDDALAVDVDVVAPLDPSLFGVSVDLAFQMKGDASPIPGPDTFVVYAEADLYGEAVHIHWECAVSGDALDCAGELKALDASFDSTASFVRGS